MHPLLLHSASAFGVPLGPNASPRVICNPVVRRRQVDARAGSRAESKVVGTIALSECLARSEALAKDLRDVSFSVARPPDRAFK